MKYCSCTSDSGPVCRNNKAH